MFDLKALDAEMRVWEARVKEWQMWWVDLWTGQWR